MSHYNVVIIFLICSVLETDLFPTSSTFIPFYTETERIWKNLIPDQKCHINVQLLFVEGSSVQKLAARYKYVDKHSIE